MYKVKYEWYGKVIEYSYDKKYEFEEALYRLVHKGSRNIVRDEYTEKYLFDGNDGNKLFVDSDNNILYYLDNDVIKTESVNYVLSHDFRKNWARQRKSIIGKIFFGDEEYFRTSTFKYISGFLKECSGKSVEVARKHASEILAKKEAGQYGQEWIDTRRRFGGMVIGIDSNIDVFPTGFSVRCLLNSGHDFSARRDFVRENGKELVKYVREEVGKARWAMKKIGDLRFYRVSEVTVLRVPEVELKFEVKRVVSL